MESAQHTTWLRHIRDALDSGDSLLPKLDLRGCEDATSLADVQAVPSVQRLCELFNVAALPAQVGWNQGSGAVSLRVMLPKNDSAALALFAAAEGDDEDVQASARIMALLWCMLGLIPAQVQLEALHAEATAVSASPAAATGGEGEEAAAAAALAATTVTPAAAAAAAQATRQRSLLLANLCLERFAAQTHVALAAKELSLRMGRLKLLLGSCRRGACRVKDGVMIMDDGERPFAYSPTYTRLSGCVITAADVVDTENSFATEHSFAYSTAELETQREELLGEMVAGFWCEARARRYMPDGLLQEQVSSYLRAYFGSGLHGQSTAFTPSGAGVKSLFYLWGLPGIGKTTFATVFAGSLEVVLRMYWDPERRVKIVKVPLNAVTPANLRAVLRVKGISDWSIERVLEQTIVKGDVALFHLEENPADAALQAALFELVTKMLTAITRLYPERAASCILYLITSNYAPAPALARVAHSVVEMAPPGLERQRGWCEGELAERLCGTLARAVEVAVSPAVMPQTSDLRALKKLVCTIAFAIVQRITASGAGVGRANGTAGAAGVASACVLQVELEPDAANEKDTSMSVIVQMRWKPADDAAAAATISLTPLRLCSGDGYFFYTREHATIAGEDVLSDAAGWTVSVRSTICCLLSMVDAAFLAPAVLCLVGGSNSARNRFCTALGTAMRVRYGDEGLCLTELDAREEGDKALVVGESHELNGGLFKVIDSAARCAAGPQTVLIVARVNAVGQFLLRELIEDGPSRTHRQAVSLRHVLFVLSIDDDCEVASQTRSRAHEVVDCADF